MTNPKTNFIHSMIKESSAYQSLEQVESDIECGGSLKNHPIEPLYSLVKDLSVEQKSLILPNLSVEQRQAFVDIDFWVKDKLDIHNAGSWIKAYAVCEDEEIRYEFCESHSFLTFMKGRVNIWTFDVEDPKYPDHDYYFLTEDSLLLVEYGEDFLEVFELKSLIRDLYSKHGVENAYCLLFKYVSESYSSLEEDEYQNKKSRLEEFGIIDYYESLNFMATFSNLSLIDNFIKKTNGLTGKLDSVHKLQTLNSYVLTHFQDDFNSVFEELEKVKSDKRVDFLKFNFIRTINASLSFNDAIRSSTLRISNLTASVKNYMLLGLNYIKKDESFKNNKSSILDHYLFSDLYKIGHSLVKIELQGLKKFYSEKLSEKEESFFGPWINFCLDSIFGEFPKVKENYYEKSSKKAALSDLETLELFYKQVNFLKEIKKFNDEFYKNYRELCDKGLLQDDFYLNYDVQDIDLESILLSALVNFDLGNFNHDNKKMGVSISELIKFSSKYDNDYQSFCAKTFLDSFGLSGVTHISSYLKFIVIEHLKGYEFESLKESDFKHVGGPIILVHH
ncbi:DUF6178 family protein [bacterium]|nr:DUF6178 family protein [bacterium]